MKYYTNYVQTDDNEQIYFSTNFNHSLGNDAPLKDVIVFNYGLVCSNFHWSKQLSYFDKLGFKILIHDYRGHYQSSGIESLSEITFENISHDMKLIFEKLNIQKSIIIAHSMGVNTALEFARRFQTLVSKLILISGTIVPVYNIMFNSNISDQTFPLFKKVLKKYPKQFQWFWKSGGSNPLIKKIVHSGGFNLKTVSSEFIEIYLNKLGHLGPELFFHLLEQMNQHDILSFINRIEVPTLLIGGDNDKVIPNYLQKLAKNEIKNSSLYIVRNGSHVPQVDFPQFVNERMVFFIKN